MNVIETRKLTKEFKGHTAVKNLDLKVQVGELYGCLGPD